MTETSEEAILHAVQIWVEGGPRALTHNALARATGRSKGNLQHYWPKAEDLLRSTALAIIAAHPGVLWPALVGKVTGQLSLDSEPVPAVELAAAEAYTWLARHGAGVAA